MGHSSPHLQHAHWQKACAQCISRARLHQPFGYYIPKLQRFGRLTLQEAGRLQGVPVEIVKAMLSRGRKSWCSRRRIGRWNECVHIDEIDESSSSGLHWQAREQRRCP
eukprot:814030-Amphidinium_carterae.1